jgi:hypothetical protein
MGKRKKAGIWAGIVSHSARAASQFAVRVGRATVRQSMLHIAKPAAAVRKSTNRGTLAAAQRWLAGVAVGSAGSRRYHLFFPAGLSVRDHPPLLETLHGCGQDGLGLARSTDDATVVRANARAGADAWAHAGDTRGKSPVRESAERRFQHGRRKSMRVVDFKRRTSLLVTPGRDRRPEA